MKLILITALFISSSASAQSFGSGNNPTEGFDNSSYTSGAYNTPGGYGASPGFGTTPDTTPNPQSAQNSSSLIDPFTGRQLENVGGQTPAPNEMNTTPNPTPDLNTSDDFGATTLAPTAGPQGNPNVDQNTRQAEEEQGIYQQEPAPAKVRDSQGM